MKRRNKVRTLLLIGVISLVVLFTMFGTIQPVIAIEGPVSSPPLGVNVDDSETLPPEDPDYGEQWGRDSGRTKTFTIFQVSEYDQLKWRTVNVGIAFDGAIDAASETLIYNGIEGGKAVWLGNTQVEVLNESTSTYESQTVSTKFILTVKDAGDSLIPFEFMDGMPVVDLTTLTPNASDEVLFVATLEMKVQMPSYDSTTAICPYAAPAVGEYLPALNVFDCLQTNPAYDRPAISKFEYGFFYALDELPTLDLAEHDEHMEELVSGVQTTVGNIQTWTEFLYDDWPSRMGGLSTGQTQIRENIAEINAKVDSLIGQPGQQDTVLNMLDKIDEGVGKVPDFLLLMFGLEDFIGDEELKALVPVIIASSPLYQSLDAMSETLTDIQSSTGLYTQEQVDEIVAAAVAAKDEELAEKDELINQLINEIQTMYTQEQVDEIVAIISPGNSENAPGRR